MSDLLQFAAILYLILIVHEFGHWMAGFVLGRPISSLTVGTGPLLWSFLWRGMWFRFRMIPSSGAVVFCWPSRTRWKDIVVFAAGPAATLVAAASLVTTWPSFTFVAIFSTLFDIIPWKSNDAALIMRKLRS